MLNSRLFMAQRPVLKIETTGQRPRADTLAMHLFNVNNIPKYAVRKLKVVIDLFVVCLFNGLF